MKRREETLVALVAVVLILAAGLFAAEKRADAKRARREQSFQQLVRGVGLGPAVDMSGCEAAFDVRICPTCSHDIGPLPLGSIYCPHHALSVSADRTSETGAQDFHNR